MKWRKFFGKAASGKVGTAEIAACSTSTTTALSAFLDIEDSTTNAENTCAT